MGQPEPIYTADNIRIAYQLNWSLTVFWKSPPSTVDWLAELVTVTERDGVRILQHQIMSQDCSLFLISTKPYVKPVEVARSVKGRLQHLIREVRPRPFQRNYDLRSIGSTKRDKLEAYVVGQLEHHALDDVVLLAQFEDLQIIDPEVNLARWRVTNHARYWSNLHLVLVHDWRYRECDQDVWLRVRDFVRLTAAKKRHLLSRVGILPDHLHLTLGMSPCESPLDVALAYLNNLAYAQGMRPVFMHSCFLGTFGEYDLGAVE